MQRTALFVITKAKTLELKYYVTSDSDSVGSRLWLGSTELQLVKVSLSYFWRSFNSSACYSIRVLFKKEAKIALLMKCCIFFWNPYSIILVFWIHLFMWMTCVSTFKNLKMFGLQSISHPFSWQHSHPFSQLGWDQYIDLLIMKIYFPFMKMHTFSMSFHAFLIKIE